MAINPPLPLGRIAIPDPQDAKYPLRAITRSAGSLPTKAIYHPIGPVLDQSTWLCPWLPQRHSQCAEQGFCTGATAHQGLRAGPFMVKNPPDPLTIYHEGQLRDEWPASGVPTPTDPYPDASEYAGGSVRGVMKYIQELGFIGAYHWAQTAEDIAAFMPQGCVWLGTNWYYDMFRPNAKTGFASVSGRVSGGHAYLCIGYNPRSGAFRCVSSWGSDWAQRGRFWLAGEDVARLMREDGEACAGVKTPKKA
jgi:hypothetical protein